MNEHRLSLKRQRGAVLVTATIVLLAVAALGIGMAANSRYQTMMAANYRERIRAFYAADGVITWLAQEVLNGNKGKYIWFSLTNGIVGISGTDPIFSGTYSRQVDVYRLTGGGSGISGTSDAFQYARGKGAGNLDIIVRVDSVRCANTSAPASAGIMVRQNTRRDTLFAAVSALPNNKGIEFRVRDVRATVSKVVVKLPSFKPPLWLRMKREGHRFSAYFSTDGESFLLLGSSVKVTMTDSVLVGLYATSGNNSDTCSVRFSDLSGFPNLRGTDTVAMGTYDVRYDFSELRWREFQISATAFKRGATTAGAFSTTLNQFFTPAMASVATTPDTVVVPATFFDFHGDGSCPEFGCYQWLWRGDRENAPCANAESTLARRLGPDGLPQPGPGRNCRRMWGADRLWKAWPQYTGSQAILNRLRPQYWYNDMVIRVDTLTVDTVYKNVRVDTFLVFRNIGAGMYGYTDLFFMPLKKRGFKAIVPDEPDCRLRSYPAYGLPPEWARCDYPPGWYGGWWGPWNPSGCTEMWKAWTQANDWGAPWSDADAPNSHFLNCTCSPTSIFADDCNDYVVNGTPSDTSNFCFTSMIRTRFVFEPGLKFKFAGDDDVWVFIDSTLVMDNQNGAERADSVILDNLGSLGVNLIPDSSYDFLFLHIERMPCGSSVNIETNIKLWLAATPEVRRFKRDYGVLD